MGGHPVHNLIKVRRAYSLLELALVIAIIAVISAMALPRMSNSYARWRVDMAARRAAADFQWIRSRARAAGHSKTVVFNTALGQYSVAALGDSNDPNANYLLDVGKNFNASISSANFGGTNSLTFDGYGQPQASGSVVFSLGSCQRLFFRMPAAP